MYCCMALKKIGKKFHSHSRQSDTNNFFYTNIFALLAVHFANEIKYIIYEMSKQCKSVRLCNLIVCDLYIFSMLIFFYIYRPTVVVHRNIHVTIFFGFLFRGFLFFWSINCELYFALTLLKIISAIFLRQRIKWCHNFLLCCYFSLKKIIIKFCVVMCFCIYFITL